MKKLFYDGSCSLCQREISWLRPKLTPHLDLVDISDVAFTGYKGVNKATMMRHIHLWHHDHFITGIDASLHYWQLAGHRWIVTLLRLPLCYWIATKAYASWASRRARCSVDKECKLP
jgi:predicted DCC family thiol-disulfide oxidoreductase YuxK